MTVKRIIAVVLSLCLLLPAAALAVSAEVGYTLTLLGEGDPVECNGATAYTLTKPNATPEGKVFAGWQGTLGGAQVFLPVGAEVTLTEDATLSAVYVGIEMRSAPQIRYDINGLRFLTKIDRADLTALQHYTTVGFGTLIAPQNHLAKNKSMTHANFAATGKAYLDVVTAGEFAKDETTFWLAGSIGHVREKNFCRTLLAAGYLSVTYTDGSTGYVYAPVKGSDRGNYLYTFALADYTNRTVKPDASHPNAVEGGYSPLNAAQLSFLERVLDTTVNITLTGSASDPTVTLGPRLDYYTVPFAAAYDKRMEWIVLTVREGETYRFTEDYQSLILDGMVVQAGRDENSDFAFNENGTKMFIPYGEYSDFY